MDNGATSGSERAGGHLPPGAVRARFAAHVLSRLWAAHLNDTRPAPLSHSSTHADFERRTRTGNLKWIDAKSRPIEFQMRFPDFLSVVLV